MAHTITGIKRQKKYVERKKIEEKALEALSEHNKCRKVVPLKRKTHEELLKLIHPLLVRPECFVRLPHAWKSQSYNLNRQICDFVKYLYCKYDAPYFLLKLFIPNYYKLSGYTRKHNSSFIDKHFDSMYIETIVEFGDWFFAIASGKSFHKLFSKEFTKREAHLFLNGNSDYSIINNFWLAKCRSNNLNSRLTEFFINKFDTLNHIKQELYCKRYSNILGFFNRFQDEIHMESFNEIIDYVINLYNNDRNTTLKGRTYQSLVKASNEWHKDVYLKSSSMNYVWAPLQINKCDWSYKDQSGVVWYVEQLCNGKELYAEGRIMQHCVSAYGSACKSGRSFIFSLRKSDGINSPERAVTIEVTPFMKIVQARKKRNEPMSAHETNVLNRWATENNIAFNKYY